MDKTYLWLVFLIVAVNIGWLCRMRISKLLLQKIEQVWLEHKFDVTEGVFHSFWPPSWPLRVRILHSIFLGPPLTPGGLGTAIVMQRLHKKLQALDKSSSLEEQTAYVDRCVLECCEELLRLLTPERRG